MPYDIQEAHFHLTWNSCGTTGWETWFREI